MPEAVVTEQLSKRYLLGEGIGSHRTLGEALAAKLTRGRRGGHGRPILWALRDVGFSVEQGEAVGIIGRNGAGKTTLLKILTRITEPTAGVARTRGRVGALLEVGTGFHPELTGRENIFLNGALMGMTRRDIRARLDEIVEFSGVERFLDTPLKRYSSGMSLRLAFSVAAHLEPDIVVIDEVLMVGDAEFQSKCLGKMSGLEREGRTLLFVSHDLGAISSLCGRAIWLEKGAIRQEGTTSEVVEAYMRSTLVSESRVEIEPESQGPVQLLSVAVRDPNEPGEERLARDRGFSVELSFSLRERVLGFDLAVYVRSPDGISILDEAWSESRGLEEGIARPGRYRALLRVPPVLAPGEYLLGVWLGNDYEDFFVGDLMSFRVSPSFGDRELGKRRLIRAPVEWVVEETSPPAALRAP